MTVQSSIALSVIAPAHNEEANLTPLVEEIRESLDPLGLDYEIIIVDDGSTDDTGRVLQQIAGRCPRVVPLAMVDPPPGRGHGQSAAFHAAIRAAPSPWIAFLDADGQNDPADLPRLIECRDREHADVVQGDRSSRRQDHLVRRVSSVIGRLTRRWLLGDTIRDTGCSLRLMRREVALELPLHFNGMHRFIPLTARHLGYLVVELPVHHRPRRTGPTKYGIRNRAWPGFFDCLAVRWMHRRRRPVTATRLEPIEMHELETVA